MRKLFPLLLCFLSSIYIHQANALTTDQLREVRNAVNEMCRGGTDEGEHRNYSITGTIDGSIILFKKLLKLGSDGTVAFSEEKWKGLKAITDGDQKSHVDCVKTISPIIIKSLGKPEEDPKLGSLDLTPTSFLSLLVNPGGTWYQYSSDQDTYSERPDLGARILFTESAYVWHYPERQISPDRRIIPNRYSGHWTYGLKVRKCPSKDTCEVYLSGVEASYYDRDEGQRISKSKEKIFQENTAECLMSVQVLSNTKMVWTDIGGWEKPCTKRVFVVHQN